MKIKKNDQRYSVLVDDNYHYMDESERYTEGAYTSFEDALNKCKEVTTQSLMDMYEEGISAKKLHAQWAMFGEDPFISGDVESERFSAREFITNELCKEVIKKVKDKKS